MHRAYFSRRLARCAAAALFVAGFSCPAVAQTALPMTPNVGFPVSLVSPDGAHGLALNPSSLGTLSGASLAYSHVARSAGSALNTRSDAAWFASRLGSHLAIGTGVDFVRASGPSLYDTNGFALGGAINAGPRWSLGAAWHLRSPERSLPNVHTADVALTFRPSPSLALSLIGRDLAAERVHLGAAPVRRSGLLAVHARPLGDDRLMLEMAGLVDRSGHAGARLMAQTYVPHVGNLGFAAELSEIAGREVWTLSGGLDLRWGTLSVAPALHGATSRGEVGWSTLAVVNSAPRPGLPAARYAARVRLTDLGSRGVLRTVLALDAALHDPRVAGVMLEPATSEAGLATAQEVRLMVDALARAGKPTYCHLETASGSAYYLCAGAKRVSIDPAGMIRLMGVSSDSLYFGELLQDVGIRADFIRIGRYKSLPEQYTNRSSSDGAREQRTALLDDAYGRLSADLARDLHLDESKVRALIDQGPFLPKEAIASKLVAAEVDPHDLEEEAHAVFGKRTPLIDQAPRASHARFGPTPQVAVVVVDGPIVDGENVDVPFFDVHMTGGRTIVETLDRLTADPRIAAIVLRIDSGGGAVMASDQIWRAVRRARAKKPVVASMGNVAASGGYYVASAANEIWASPSTITGSIGIFYGKVDVAALAARFGVGIETDKRGMHAGADSPFHPFSAEERAAFTEKLRVSYRQFLERVAEGRHMPIEKVDELGRGRVYSGDAAERVGLVDSLGGFGSALARARQLASLPDDSDVVIVPRRPSTLLDFVRQEAKTAAENPAQMLIPAALKPLLSRLYLLVHTGGTVPLALFEGPARLD